MSLTCEQASGLNDVQYWSGFYKKIERLHIPFSGSVALTYRCNLSCAHCYAKKEPGEQVSFVPELDTEQWRRAISQSKAAGCLHLLLTGGEPLLREDFSEIYSFAKQSGFLVTVFSNGTLVTDKIAALFRELPPRQVEVSLYGASAETYERVSGVPGSFKKAMQGIETLIGQGTKVDFKSVLLTLNAGEFAAIEKLASSFGAKMRFDAAIFPALSGDRSILDLRVAPEEAVALELAAPKRASEWRELLQRYRGQPHPKTLYSCGAGETAFHIDPYGWLYPCLMVKKVKYFLPAGCFEEGWNEVISRFREGDTGVESECGRCSKRLLCGYCPGFFELENGDERIPSAYLCAIGKLRFEQINSEAFGG
jgi:radical SAM protein with 4Fe4S-binding SPASM domain